MRFLIPILIIFGLIGCKTQKFVTIDEITDNNLEPGKCYFTLRIGPSIDKIDESNLKIEAKIEEPFILEVIPTKYQEFEINYSCEELRTKVNSEENIRHQILEAHTKFIIKDSNLSDFTTINNPSGFLYCLVEVPSQWKLIFGKELKGDSIKILEKRIIAKSKIIKTYIKKKPSTLKKTQKYFEGGLWTLPKEAIVGSCRGMGDQFVISIKKALINLGYEVTLKPIIDNKTKESIIDFQRKNNLPEGRIDIKTLKKLGIKY